MEKTIEELQAELDALKKSNLEAELAKEKMKAEDEARLRKEAEMEKLRKEIREEVLGQVKAESKIASTTPTKLDGGNSDFEEFKSVFTDKYKLSGVPYESYIHKLAFKGYKK